MKKILLMLATGLAGFALSSGYALAQVAIDQNRAMAGGVTPGDTPGFPVTISIPGSYKLTSNLVVPAGLSGIVIAASDVSLDLNGFSVTGTGTCTSAALGNVTCSDPAGGGIVAAGADQRRATIANGSVGGFGDCLRAAYQSRVHDIDLHDCEVGLYVPMGSRVTRVGVGLSRYGAVVYGAVVQDLSITTTVTAVNTNTSVFTGLNVNGAAVGFATYYGASPSTLYQSQLNSVTSPFAGTPKSMGNNLCNGATC